jgi:hypothetical protein
MSGKSLENFSISSSPVTFTTVSRGASNSSRKKSLLRAAVLAVAGRAGMSPSREMSGNCDAAASKSMSSPPPPVKLLLKKSVIVDGGEANYFGVFAMEGYSIEG